MIRYLLAMDRELESFLKVYPKCPKGSVELIGIGATEMKDGDENDVLVNIGYAGGYRIPKGALVEPMCAMDGKAHEAIRIDSIFPIERRVCFTSDEFVTEPFAKYRAVYDMELFKIAKKPHKKLYSVKIVSDSLDENECESFNGEGAWETIAGYLAEYLKDDKK